MWLGSLRQPRYRWLARKGQVQMASVSRFNAFSQLRDELDRAKQELEDRKVIDRAKGILMKERGLSEDAAYGLLRKAAMNENRRLAEVAQSLITATRLLK